MKFTKLSKPSLDRIASVIRISATFIAREYISLLEQELIRQGYKDATLKYYRNIWRRIAAYFESRGEIYFSESVAMEYVDIKCDFFTKEKAGQLTQSNVWLFRVVRMMGDFQQHGTVLRRYSRSLSRVNEPLNQQSLEKFATYCKSNEYSTSTQKSYQHTAENFLCFLEARKVSLDAINTSCLNEFLKTLMGYSYKTVEFVLCGTRVFLRFLYSEEFVSTDWSGALPCMQARRQTRIPSVWNQGKRIRIA